MGRLSRVSILTAFACSLLATLAARAQDLPQCATVDPGLVKVWAEARKASSNCPVSCHGCGCKGGPGYRKPPPPGQIKGNCASYAELVHACGPPPHDSKGCVRECAPVAVGCRRPTAAEVDAAAKPHSPAKPP